MNVYDMKKRWLGISQQSHCTGMQWFFDQHELPLLWQGQSCQEMMAHVVCHVASWKVLGCWCQFWVESAGMCHCLRERSPCVLLIWSNCCRAFKARVQQAYILILGRCESPFRKPIDVSTFVQSAAVCFLEQRLLRADSDSKLKTMRDTLYDGVSGCAIFLVWLPLVCIFTIFDQRADSYHFHRLYEIYMNPLWTPFCFFVWTWLSNLCLFQALVRVDSSAHAFPKSANMWRKLRTSFGSVSHDFRVRVAMPTWSWDLRPASDPGEGLSLEGTYYHKLVAILEL